MQGVFPGCLVRSAGRQSQARPVAPAEQLRRHQENALAQGLKGGSLELRRQAEPLGGVEGWCGSPRAPAPAPAASNRACPFRALGSPGSFMPGVMIPIALATLSGP